MSVGGGVTQRRNPNITIGEFYPMGIKKSDIEPEVPSSIKKKMKKKRSASDLDLAASLATKDKDHVEAKDELHVEDDLNEPTMGEKLASLNLVDDDKTKSLEEEYAPGPKPPSADSVHVLLKQALHADDRAQLLTCLYTQDEKVISNTTSLLNPSDVLKLLDSLISIMQSRGAVLACALPWLRSLLLQHASGIISQESSLLALNSIYQLIESRVSTFRPALQLSSCLDYLFTDITEDEDGEISKITPAIYEDKDESDEESEDDVMDDDDNEEPQEGVIDGSVSDFDDESDDDMSD